MADWKASLFGKFNIQWKGLQIDGIGARKVQELLTYLLVFRNHPRELLCETLWGDQSSVNPRKYLRQTLWRLQSALNAGRDSNEVELRMDDDWLQIKLPGNFWLDIEEFENVFNLVKRKRSPELSLHEFTLLEYAVGLYRGNLLEGWYSDWCVFERERFQTMHLLVTDPAGVGLPYLYQ